MRRPKRALGETPRHLRKGRTASIKPRRSRLPAPVLTYLGAGRWRLEKPYLWNSIAVPEGFMFDLASVPRAFWWLIAPFELSIVAPLIHDWLCSHGKSYGYSRKQADEIFSTLMELEGVPRWRRRLAYRAVRLNAIFGG